MKIENLGILKGTKTTVKSGQITYLPEFETVKEGDTKNPKPISADIKADKEFYQGELKFKFKTQKPDAGVILVFEDGDSHISTVGLSRVADAFVIVDKLSNVNIKAGNIKNYELNSEILIKVDWNGSKMKLYVNNVILCETNSFSLRYLPIHFRITSSGEVKVYDIELNSLKPKLFVVMQFTDDYNKLYSEVIHPVAEKMGFECIRADEHYSSTPILKDIITSIEESSAIIADITPDNPNVFYEIGYSHAINKPTILLCDKKREKLPFDISGFRTLFYENTIAGKSQIEKNLSKYLLNLKS
ncbi:MAG: hypothetical protein U0073_12125 [Bacteroidia bacterium]